MLNGVLTILKTGPVCIFLLLFILFCRKNLIVAKSIIQHFANEICNWSVSNYMLLIINQEHRACFNANWQSFSVSRMNR